MNIPQTQPTPKQEREYLHTLSAGAFLPFIQATLLALVIFIAVYVIAAVVFNAIDPHKPATFCSAIAWVWMMWRLMRHWLYLTTPFIETITHRDINGDGVIGKVEPSAVDEEPIKTIPIRLIKENGHVSSDINLPGDMEALRTLARGLLNGMPFSESFWTGKDKPFSSKTFRALRDVMRSNGLAEYINETEPKQGIRLTDAGRAVMEKLASPYSPTEESETEK